MLRARFLTAVFAGAGALLVLFLAMPLVAMVASERPATLWDALAERDARSAVLVSAGAAAVSTALALVLGVPMGYVLARREFPGKAAIQALVDMPVVVPHLVAGIALLTVLGPQGVVGGPAGAVGLRFVDALPGTVAAMLFVSAPLVVNAARHGFEAVNPRLEQVSRSLGASPLQTFLRVSMPLAKGPIVSGAVISWARAVSEFGAVLVIAYYPRVAPTLIYERYTGFGLRSARPIALCLLLICLSLFALVRLLVRRSFGASGVQGRAQC